jgi:anti-sigma-K factor RskA
MSFHRDEIDELLGAYALDAIDPDERRLVEEYLAHNPRARAEVEQHREVATLLSYSGAPAPDGLWERIAESLDDRIPDPGPELAKVMPIWARFGRASANPAGPTRVSWRLAGSIAAAAAVVIGLLSWRLVDTNRRLTDARASSATLVAQFARLRTDSAARRAQLVSSDGVRHTLALVDRNGTGYLDGTALAVLDTDHTYQLWGVVQTPDGDQVISLGVLGPQFDIAPFTVRQGTLVKLVLTEETRGGVPVSSQPAALAGDII